MTEPDSARTAPPVEVEAVASASSRPAVDVAGLQRRARVGVMALVARTAVMQLVVLGGDLYLRRRLEPADFGLYAIVQFALAVFMQFGDVGLASALIRQSATPTRRELSSAWCLQMLVASSITLVLWMGAPLMLHFWSDMSSDGIWVLRALSIDLLLSSARLTPTLLMERELEYTKLSALEVLQSMTYYVAAICFAATGHGVMSLAYAVLSRSIAGVLGAHLLRPFRPSLVIDWQLIRPTLHFGVRFQLKNVTAFLSSAIAPVYGGRVLGQAQLGFINLGQSTAYFPLKLVEVMARVSFPLFSRLQHEPKAFAATLERGVMISAMGTLFFVGLAVGLGPNLIAVLYGAKWLPALPLFYVYALALSIGFLHPVVAPAIDAIGKPGLNLKMMVVWTTAMVVLVALLTPRYGALGFAIGMSIPTVLGNVVVLYILKQLVPDAHLWPRTRALIAGAITVALLGRFALAHVCSGPLSFAGGVAASVAVFLGIVGLLDRSAIHELVGLIRKNVPQTAS
ncbi:MAG TPA: oligosaccharide flippase family protein [Polyangiaceae bacterium]|nr:oligosaccharide flippase family protein [Polyangiaceae bacterium]